MAILQKEFKYNSFFSNMFLIFSVICISVSVYFKGGSLPRKPILIMPIIVFLMFKNYSIIKMYGDYCEIKIAPLRAAKLIRYNDLSSVTMVKNKI